MNDCERAILDYLADGQEHVVGEIAEAIGYAPGQVGRRLRSLARYKFIEQVRASTYEGPMVDRPATWRVLA